MARVLLSPIGDEDAGMPLSWLRREETLPELIPLLLRKPIGKALAYAPKERYGSAGDLGFIFLPVMAKFYAAESFYLSGGPQLSFSTTLSDIKGTVRSAIEIIDEDYNGTIESVLKNVGVDLGFGAGYDINENFAVQARYSFELSNRYDGPGSGLLKLRAQQLNVGLVCFF